MKSLIVVGGLIVLTGCGLLQQQKSHFSGTPTEICYDGVVYLQFTSGTCPKYGLTGLVYCGELK